MIPENILPTYEVTLPSSGKRINVRPFIVGEEKLLFIALESNDDKEIIRTTQQVISSCILDKGVKLDDLPFFDLDYLFIFLRAKSVGETIPVKFTCNAMTSTGKCGNIFDANIDALSYKLVKNDEIKPKIAITDNVTIVMKYPSYAAMKEIVEKETVLSKKIRLIAASIKCIQEGEKVLTDKDYTKKELIGFIESLRQEQFKKLEQYVDNFPSFVFTSKAKCEKCGYDHSLEYTDFPSFFA